MNSKILRFRHLSLSILQRRSYATTNFSQSTLEHFKAKVSPKKDDLTMAKLKDILNSRLGHTSWLNRHNRLEQHASAAAVQGSKRIQSELPPRKMSESFSTAIIPLSKDLSLQDRYVTFLGHVRLGRLMEDLDLFAVWVASNHLIDADAEARRLPGNIVTLLVDSIDFTEALLEPRRDIRVSGFVSHCGGSTIETELWMEQEGDGDGAWRIITNARFLMALRDPLTDGASPVNRLVASDEFERRLLEGARARRRLKRDEERSSPSHAGPSVEESRLLHRLMSEYVIDEDAAPFGAEREEGVLQLESARLSNTVFSHPEDRNMYNTVFGGYLMRIALELSWACAWLHTQQRPQLTRIGDIRFHRPVAVASLLRMRAFLIYSEGRDVVVKVTAFVHHPETGDTFRTNDFHFVYRLSGPAPRVLPRFYEGALMYLEGRRSLSAARGSPSSPSPTAHTAHTAQPASANS